jgi:HEAT repeat protein
VTLRLADTLEAAPKEGVRLVSSCPDPSEAPREKVWLKPVLSALARLWGDALLVTAVQDEDAQVATAAAFLLTEPSRRDTLVQAVPFLVKKLKDNNDVLRRQVVDTLAKAGPDVPGVLPALIQALDTDEDLYTREGAATALGEMGVKAVEAVPSLILALQDPYICDAAIHALGNLGSDAAPAVPALLQALEQGECSHARVIITLGMIGPAAQEAVPTLIPMLSDSSTHDYAHDALKKIIGQDLGEVRGPWQDWWSKQ